MAVSIALCGASWLGGERRRLNFDEQRIVSAAAYRIDSDLSKNTAQSSFNIEAVDAAVFGSVEDDDTDARSFRGSDGIRRRKD